MASWLASITITNHKPFDPHFLYMNQSYMKLREVSVGSEGMNNYCTLPKDRSLHLFLQIPYPTNVSIAISLNVNVLLPAS